MIWLKHFKTFVCRLIGLDWIGLRDTAICRELTTPRPIPSTHTQLGAATSASRCFSTGPSTGSSPRRRCRTWCWRSAPTRHSSRPSARYCQPDPVRSLQCQTNQPLNSLPIRIQTKPNQTRSSAPRASRRRSCPRSRRARPAPGGSSKPSASSSSWAFR